MKNWIKNWLGINALALTVTTVRKDYDKLSTQVDELETTDLSDVESRLDDVESLLTGSFKFLKKLPMTAYTKKFGKIHS